MKTIGISGCSRNRKLVAWMLGALIEEIRSSNNVDYISTCNYIYNRFNEGEDCSSSNLIIFESFGKYIVDQAKLFIGNIFTLDECRGINDYFIDIQDFKVYDKDEAPNQAIPIKEFIIRFGECLKKEFGDDVWVRSIATWTNMKDSDVEYTIYTDVKTDAEIDFIEKSGGTIINVIEPDTISAEYNKITKHDLNKVCNIVLPKVPDDKFYKFLYNIAKNLV